jgi:glycosyltransferase involved in cell wall biosynthesis
MKVLMWEHFAPGSALRVGGHHFAERFLRGGAEVAWCVGPISPINFLKTNDETRRRMQLWRRGGVRLHDGRMFAYAPMTLAPWRPYPGLDRVAIARGTLRATVPRCRGVLRRAGFEAVDLLFMEPGAPLLALLDEVPHRKSVYRMCDDTSAFPDAPATFEAIEAEVCRRVDLVVATARDLESRARSLGARQVLYLPNACDPQLFETSDQPAPADLKGIPRPRAVYAGAIDSWFDVDLLAEVASRLPLWSFLLIGPVRADLSALDRLNNIHRIGPRPYAELPAWFASADAALVPFRLSRMTHAIHPIKVYEYCAAGLPVVATPMRETAGMGAPIRLAADAAGFAEALTGFVEGESPVRRQAERAARVAFARRHSWDERFDRLLQALQGEPARLAVAGGAR